MTAQGRHNIKRNPRPILGRQYAPERQRPSGLDTTLIFIGLGILVLATIFV